MKTSRSELAAQTAHGVPTDQQLYSIEAFTLTGLAINGMDHSYMYYGCRLFDVSFHRRNISPDKSPAIQVCQLLVAECCIDHRDTMAERSKALVLGTSLRSWV